MESEIRNVVMNDTDPISIDIDISKTIFWVGAGVSSLSPCNLPLGNGLIDCFLETALGKENKNRLIKIWNEEIEPVQDCVNGNDWSILPLIRRTYISNEDMENGRGKRPRLELVAGELHKMDENFNNMCFSKNNNIENYRRIPLVRSLSIFTQATPNEYHNYIARIAEAGAIIITTNFDICIEKILMNSCADELRVEKRKGIWGVKIDEKTFIYHIHGVAIDKDIEKNLGTTLTNISRNLPEEFTEELIDLFERGYSIVYVGYSGSDFFDIKPFFDTLKTKAYKGKAIFLQFCENTDSEEKMSMEKKAYHYLLTPFTDKTIYHGNTEALLTILATMLGIARGSVKMSDGNDNIDSAFQKMKQYHRDLLNDFSNDCLWRYYFINTFRLASQLNICMGRFYDNWSELLYNIYIDFKSESNDFLIKMILEPYDITRSFIGDIWSNNWDTTDSRYIKILDEIRPIFRRRRQLLKFRTEIRDYIDSGTMMPNDLLESYLKEMRVILKEGKKDREAIVVETDFINYLCGDIVKKIYTNWMIKPFNRKNTVAKLCIIQNALERITEYPYNCFLYMTYYLSPCRQQHLISAMIDSKKDSFNKNTGTYGDIQTEWDICRESANLYDEERIILNRLLQYRARLMRLRPIRPLKALQLIIIRSAILRIKTHI